MKKTIITLITITFALLIGTKAEAQQDPNFTLYNFNMNIINPAFAGIKETPELNLVYRNQFLGIDDSPRTISMAYSKALGKNLGIGISAINDRVFVLTETDIAVDVSYKLQIDEETNLYFGLKAGGGFVNIDLTKASNPGNDPLFTQNQSFFNPHIGAGINIQNEKFYISISTPNFLKGDRYEKQGNRPSAAVDQAHFYLGGGYNITLNSSLILTPRVMMRTVEGAPTSYDLGSSLEINKKFIAGVNYRVDETVSAYGLFQVLDRLKLGAAYDVTTMDASDINDNGSLELILKYQF
ncbi:PorP/SprF family type IX secretion system membrane protein [Pseudotenacibaculum haliotis]|uniref:Type IX secretion system membrane protein PorP/SprF n=2 Tax=Pseudotenacibaculum haliotis TaxID=1862138 RepID=A0ABW5LPH0_9FLAO